MAEWAEQIYWIPQIPIFEGPKRLDHLTAWLRNISIDNSEGVQYSVWLSDDRTERLVIIVPDDC
jgi:hypothetical protein